MRKFLFDPAATTGLPDRPGITLRTAQPFVLDDEFRPVETLNAWLSSLPMRGCHSPGTWSGYADDLIAWTRFLHGLGLAPIDEPQVLRKALSKYRELRLDRAPTAVGELRPLGPSAWNRSISALENFYDWAVEENLLSGKPFRYKSMKVHRGSSEHSRLTHRNLAKAKAGGPAATIRSLAVDWADLFVEVGLGGHLPSGLPDLSFQGRSLVRNRAMGALVRSSGLRRAEFSNLLVWEVPAIPEELDDFVGFDVPASISKGSKARSTWASGRAIELVNDYTGLEREIALASSSWQPRDPLFVTEPEVNSGIINGKRVSWSRLSIPSRRRLVGPGGGSALLFVRSNGAPLAADAWRHAFDRASDRCRRFEPRFPHVTPHMLRHTFALETLNLLTRNSMSRSLRLARVVGADPVLMASLRHNDPLLILRDMLGHESVKTTEKYIRARGVTGVLTDAELDLLESEEHVDAAERDTGVKASW